MSEYLCKRIQSQVEAEKAYDLTGKIFVGCKYYTGDRNPCNKDFPRFKKCLVVKLVQKEEKNKLAEKF